MCWCPAEGVERISACEEILLRDLKLMKHKQVIHPVLQEGSYQPPHLSLTIPDSAQGGATDTETNWRLLCVLVSVKHSGSEDEPAGSDSGHRPAVPGSASAHPPSWSSSGAGGPGASSVSGFVPSLWTEPGILWKTTLSRSLSKFGLNLSYNHV